MKPRVAIVGSGILIEPGRRRMVGGQEDRVIDVAFDMVKKREAANA